MPVYLIHFNEKLSHAQHYLGSTSDLVARLHRHDAGFGARLMEVIKEKGISWQLARVWRKGDFRLERKLKARKNGPTLCPICKANRAKEKSIN